MKIALFCHSLISDWNHGNAHFLRGIAAELLVRGHEMYIYEPAEGWSLSNLRSQFGDRPVVDFHRRFPKLHSTPYRIDSLNLPRELEGIDLVIVHEWNEPELVAKIGRHHRKDPSFLLFFHDTHHRAYSAPEQVQRYDLSDYDGVLAYGEVIRRIYLENGWAKNAWTWHEAADTRIFRPMENRLPPLGDLAWIGNWGDEERTEEYREFLIEPVRELNIKARAYGVQYPPDAVKTLADAGIEYEGWVANHEVPNIFSRHRVTIHIPRRPYSGALPGIPTIRPFEALACGIPLITAPWEDSENLFTPGKDFLVAHNRQEMKESLRMVLKDRKIADALILHGLNTIRNHHTCAHRVDELLDICQELGLPGTDEPRQAV